MVRREPIDPSYCLPEANIYVPLMQWAQVSRLRPGAIDPCSSVFIRGSNVL